MKDKLAVRFSAVDEDKGFTRKPAEEKIRRYFGAIQARPFRQTTINASFEHYNNSTAGPTPSPRATPPTSGATPAARPSTPPPSG
jgi:hypothetical protein